MSRRIFTFWVILLILASCSLPIALFPTPTEIPCIACEPSPGVESTKSFGEGDCQSDFGLDCSTVIPQQGENNACLIVTRTVPPDFPTASATGTAVDRREVDPHVEVCSSALEIRKGESVTVTGLSVDIGLPIFYVNVQDLGTEYILSFRLQNDLVQQEEGQSHVLELLEASADLNQVSLNFRGIGVGKAKIIINATGEIHLSEGAMWGGGGSEPVVIQVIEP